MDWYESIFELIDMRSFSNLWFWIALAVLWSTVSHWVLGVPWDMIMRARRSGFEGEAFQDLNDMVRINVNRLLYIFRQSGLLITGFVFFALTVMVLLGFVFGREFAQALSLLGIPMALVWALSVRTASRLQSAPPADGAELFKRLYMHRLVTQMIGVFSIFVTAIWGMLQNMNASVLF